MQAPPAKTVGIPSYAAPKVQKANVAESTWVGSGNVVTFVRCLRLLDLDLRDDWPGAHEQLFSAKGSQQNLQQRVKCVEWSLYRLFEIWDPAYTKEKLQPFFPPLAPLQSLNLRAALYRGLTDLKKNGLLAKEATLRKTMLDECRGEKFEEVLRVFAIAVLRREASHKLGRASRVTTGYSEALTAPENLTVDQRERLMPLMLAHRQILQRQLTERRRINQRFCDESRHLEHARTRLAAERKALLAREEHLPRIEPESLGPLSDHVRAAWTGNQQWAETLIRGGPGDVDHLLTAKGLCDGAQQVSGTTEHVSSTSRTNSLLAELSERIDKQQARLQKWADFRASLEKSNKGRIVETVIQTRKPLVEFNAHQELHVDQVRNEATASTEGYRQAHLVQSEVIEAMRAELKNLRRSRPLQRSAPIKPDNRTCTLEELQLQHENVGAANNAGESLFQETAKNSKPFRENVAQGHVDSAMARYRNEYHHDRFKNAANSSGHHHIQLNDVEDMSAAQDFPRASGAATPNKPPICDDCLGPSDRLMTEPISTEHIPGTQSPDNLPNLPPASLASTLLERTRISMATLTRSFDSPAPTHPQSLNPTTNIPNRQNKRPQKDASHSSASSKFSLPVNQLPTPRKQPRPIMSKAPTRTNLAAPPTPSKNSEGDRTIHHESHSPTPQDDLFSDQADYASVFKSRPRVAVSPPATSPERRGSGFRGSGGQGVDADDDESDDDGGVASSPTRR